VFVFVRARARVYTHMIWSVYCISLLCTPIRLIRKYFGNKSHRHSFAPLL